MKLIKRMTADECNAEIRQLQKDMATALNSDSRDSIRARIALLAQQAAYLNRNNLSRSVGND